MRIFLLKHVNKIALCTAKSEVSLPCHKVLENLGEFSEGNDLFKFIPVFLTEWT